MKQFSVKNFYIFFSSIFIFLMHLPFINAKGKPAEGVKIPVKKEALYLLKDSMILPEPVIIPNKLPGIYDSLQLNVIGLSKQAFQYAVKGLEYLGRNGKLANETIISIVDFSLPSSKKRLFVIDLDIKKVLFNTYVAHGMNSGKEFASQFSNYPASNKSSLGFYETATTYMGKNGYSLHLQGLEKGINDNATRRDIVIHGAEYVNEGYVQMQGYIGRSQGCPAVPEKLHRPIIDKIKNGTCLFIYSPDKHYFIHSRILKEAGLMALGNNN